MDSVVQEQCWVHLSNCALSFFRKCSNNISGFHHEEDYEGFWSRSNTWEYFNVYRWAVPEAVPLIFNLDEQKKIGLQNSVQCHSSFKCSMARVFVLQGTLLTTQLYESYLTFSSVHYTLRTKTREQSLFTIRHSLTAFW